jgi:FMN phosphatase YigB (HAD superfamily)
LIFDLDGTLYELPGRKLKMTLALWRNLGLLRRMGGARRSLRQRTFDDREALQAEFRRELGRRAGVSPERAGEWFEQRFMVAFVKMLRRRGQVRAGLVELLARLRDRGVKLAVLSDFGWVEERLEALRIPRDLFNDVVAAEDFGVLKPSPVPFMALARRWEVEPAELAVVGDRWDLDGASAEAAGMGFIGVQERSLTGSGQKPGLASWEQVASEIERRTISCGQNEKTS